MRRSISIIASAAMLSVAIAAAPVSAQNGLDRIELPDGWFPEGITTDGTTLYAGSLANGAIWKADPTTGEGSVLVPGTDGMVAVGMDVSPDGQTLWVAGGRTGEIRAYYLATGELLSTYPAEAGFLNDVAVTPEAVYVTDSFMPQVVVIPLGEDGALPGPDGVASLPISGELGYGDNFNVNGIVATDAGLVVVHFAEGALYRVDSETGESFLIDSADVALTGGDGLELDGDVLYVIRNSADTVTAVQLDSRLQTATLIAETGDEDFDTPTTAALIGGDLWVVNARFGSGGADAPYWITRLDAAAPDSN